ncbi:MAG: AMP-binding protein [Clostridia bacterium]|nr:AMP-binding protein [Clostridia bacterium]
MKKELKALIENNSSALENSSKDFEALYNIIFSNGNRTLCETNDGFRKKLTSYSEMKAQIEKLSRALYAKIGMCDGYVALEMENSPLWIAAFWSILKSGNRPYLVNCRHPKKLSDGIIKSLGIRYIVSDRQGELSGEYIDAGALSATDEPEFSAEFANEIALSTSATTMKEVVCFYTGKELSEQVLCARSIVKECPRIADHYKGELKQLAFLPFYHIFGLIAVYFWFTFYGRTFVFLRDYSPDTILKTVRRHEVTHIFAVPMLWHTIEKQLWKQVKKKGDKKTATLTKALKITTTLQNLFPRAGSALSKKLLAEATDSIFGRSVLFCISGGSALRPSAQYTMNALGYPLYNGYGMSEIGITSVELRKTPKKRNEGSIGHPVASVEYRLDDDGVLYVRGSSICKRMTVNGVPLENSDWFFTGDIMEEKNGYYYIKGRQGDRIIGENGENIDPDLIESCFELSDCNAFSVLGLGEGDSERLSLIISVNPFLSKRRLDALCAEAYKVNDTLSSAMKIKDFYFTTDPLSPPTAVKVGRAYLKRAIGDGSVSLTSFTDTLRKSCESKEDDSNASPLFDEIRTIVASVLDISPSEVGDDTHIVNELSASSLQYFSIITELSRRFSITEYSERDKYRYTVRELAEYISENI